MANAHNYKFAFHPYSNPKYEGHTGYIEIAEQEWDGNFKFLDICQGKLTGKRCPFFDAPGLRHCTGFTYGGGVSQDEANVFVLRADELRSFANCKPTLATD